MQIELEQVVLARATSPTTRALLNLGIPKTQLRALLQPRSGLDLHFQIYLSWPDQIDQDDHYWHSHWRLNSCCELGDFPENITRASKIGEQGERGGHRPNFKSFCTFIFC